MLTLATRLGNKVGRGFVSFVSRPASPRPLAALRIGLAAVLLLQAFSLAAHVLDLFGERGIVQWKSLPFQPPAEVPSITAVSSLLAPLGVSAASSVRLVFFTYVASLVLLLVGFQTRPAAIVAWLTQMALKTTGSTSIYGVDEFAHIALFYCVWMPVGSAWALDRASDAPSALARLSLRVLQLHLCIVYLSSGIEKATGEQWWNGEAIWRSLMRPDFARGYDFSWLADYQTLTAVLCIGTLVVEIGYVVMIWNRWTRPVWAAQTIALHAGIGLFMGLWSFAAVMIVLNVATLVVSAEPRVAPAAEGESNATPALAAA